MDAVPEFVIKHRLKMSRLCACLRMVCIWLLLSALLSNHAVAAAQQAGLVKMLKGDVHILRDGQTLTVTVGQSVMANDTLVTAANSSVAVILNDGTSLSTGPNSLLVLNKFVFHEHNLTGELDASIKKGTLAVISGKLAKTSRDAVVFRTPNAILGVRGTAFVIEVGEDMPEAKP